MDEWKGLLQKHQLQTGKQSGASDGASEGGSLLQQVRELVGQTDKTLAAGAELPGKTEGSVCLQDGYVRRSPVQEYVTPKDYRRKTVRKVVLIVIGVCFAVLLVIALLRTGLLSFK